MNWVLSWFGGPAPPAAKPAPAAAPPQASPAAQRKPPPSPAPTPKAPGTPGSLRVPPSPSPARSPSRSRKATADEETKLPETALTLFEGSKPTHTPDGDLPDDEDIFKQEPTSTPSKLPKGLFFTNDEEEEDDQYVAPALTAEELAELFQDECKQLADAAQLAKKGMTLGSTSEKGKEKATSSDTKVVYSLGELSLHRKFKTDGGFELERISQTEVKLASSGMNPLNLSR